MAVQKISATEVDRGGSWAGRPFCRATPCRRQLWRPGGESPRQRDQQVQWLRGGACLASGDELRGRGRACEGREAEEGQTRGASGPL